MQKEGASGSTSLTLMPTTDLATGEILSPYQTQALISYSREHGLDPRRGHCVLMRGQPYFTIAGYIFYAHLTHRPYTLSSRPFETQELKRYQVAPTDYAWVAEVHFPTKGTTFPGIGFVNYSEITGAYPQDLTNFNPPVVAPSHWQLAQKRAEWLALYKAFPIGESREKERE